MSLHDNIWFSTLFVGEVILLPYYTCQMVYNSADRKYKMSKQKRY